MNSERIIVHQGPAGTGKSTATEKLLYHKFAGKSYERKNLIIDNEKFQLFKGAASCDVVVVESVNSKNFEVNMIMLKNHVGESVLVIVETQEVFNNLDERDFDVKTFSRP